MSATPVTGPAGDLPEPTGERWQPLRLGLVDLFHYDHEEFRFHDGRLLLRGNNGTGKSKVMALTLPFLLDGQMSPARVEPDGDPSKRMEWNLLLGQAGERQGYTWLEFGRMGEAGPEYRTIGCGLKAVAQRGVRSWFFITPQRPGESLFLVEDGRTLGRDRLAQALDDSGALYDQAQAYRRAVDEQFFQLGAERYEALLDLLLQLRQPQLSKTPDESRLSRALTEALPPLDQGVINDVADAYRSLDAMVDEADALEQARDAVFEFLQHYRRYAAVAARRRSAEVRAAHSEYEDVRAQLGRAREELEQTREREADAGERERTLRTEVDAAEQRRRTLRDSPAMRSAESLHNAEQAAEQQRRYADQQAERHRESENRLREAEQRRDEQRELAEQARTELEEVLTRLGACAEGAGVVSAHREQIQRLGLTAGGAPDGEVPGEPPERVRERLLEIHRRRQEAVALLEEHHHAVAEAERRLARAQGDWQHHSDEQDRVEQAHQAARQATEEAGETLQGAWRSYLAELTELRPDDAEQVLAELTDWVARVDDRNPAENTLEARRQALTAELAGARSEREHQRQQVDRSIEALEAERARLTTGEELAPPAPHTRSDEQRAERPGAPLWQLVDFRDEVPEAERAGLEAALEAAGLLDAWILPEGTAMDAGVRDTLLTTEAPEPAVAVDRWLVPDVRRPDGDPPVSPERVAALLARIGAGEPAEAAAPGPAWVAVDGRWQLGPARGDWGKERARYIGHTAREAARRARLEEIDAELAELGATREEIDAALAGITERSDRIDQEWARRPADTPLRDAHAAEAAALRAVEAQTERTEQARQTLEARRREAEQARQERDERAAELHLPTAEGQLQAVRQALAEYADACRGLRDALRVHGREAERLRRAEEEAQRADEVLRVATRERDEAERQARDAETHRDTLRESIGAEVAALERQLHEVDATLQELAERREHLQQERTELSKRIGALESDIANAEQRLEELGQRREHAVQRLRRFAEAGLMPVATDGELTVDDDASWAPEPTVQRARRLEQALADVDAGDAAWQRQQKGLHEHFTALQTALGRQPGHDAQIEQQDDLLLVRVTFQSRHHGPDELAAELDRELERRRELLTARERELVENYLIDEVASHLQHRLAATERQVRQMNEELAQRPTSTGMRLRIAWQPLAEGETAGGLNIPTGLEATRDRLLRQSMDAWTPSDRQAVGDFIQLCIQEARREYEGAALPEILERGLDYRYWHRFTVERWQSGRWRPAYGPASGGERALVITLPLFAAAASHYGSAHPAAPRLIMLDEVFAGVDDDARAKSMGLLAQFDLDALMTSEREWGCYPEVPGLAIAQLVRRDDVDAVFVSRWRWDGARRIREAEPGTPLERPGRAPAPDSEEGPEEGSLF
ncbi:TIGR02680 family protein [Thioalkalivibrio sp. ALE11]|uniref:TIGR02680 family protein n=1 Tax=Thioalkalivibrio sp. ALE11 TaxID=1265494 RepID=UPI0003818E75|nr:TIGR02680 family protein [Thioalkalivibrio sp. ALE11]